MNLLKRLSITIGILPVILATVPVAAAPKASAKLPKPLTLQVKFKEASQVDLQGNQFVSQSGQDMSNVNQLLQKHQVVSKGRLLQSSREEVKQQRQQAKAHKAELNDETSADETPDLNSYYRLKAPNLAKLDSLIAELRLQNVIETVYAEQAAPPPPTVTANYSALQLYFKPAAAGMSLTAFNTTPGALGEKVNLADVEYSWNTAHEDLPLSPYIVRDKVGTPSDPYSNNNHGTAVAGVIMAKRNSVGVDGIASASHLRLVNTYSQEFGWDPANAVYTASSHLTKGDVMVIEQQAYDDQYNFLPLEYIPSVYDAIKLATQNGIIVVEAAGNGGVNLDNYGTTFPAGKTDSGAIMVGAGAACGTQANRTRLSFSNYGKRLNVQGHGECVATTGFGDLFAPTTNRLYTKTFDGTSSATATVAGAVAALSSAYETKLAKPLTPAKARSVLISTGTVQNTTILPGKIGPLPNIPKAYTASLLP